MMRDYGGFEGNGQTLRLLTKVENSYGSFGLDLTRRALLGILKYPVPRSKVASPKRPPIHESIHKTIKISDWLPPKAYFDCEQAEVDWILAPFTADDQTLLQALTRQPAGTQAGKSLYCSFDCSIMNTADDIAYGVHDLEDAIHLRLIERSQLETLEFKQLLGTTLLAPHQNRLLESLFSQDLCLRKRAVGEMVNYFITSTQISISHEAFESPLLKYTIALIPEAGALLNYLMDCIYTNVIDSQEARTFEYGGQTVVLRLFDAISSNPGSLLDTKNRDLFKQAQEETAAYRVVCDYLANMTDEYAYRMHERLFGFNTRTIFERL
jgi:dGTPase